MTTGGCAGGIYYAGTASVSRFTLTRYTAINHLATVINAGASHASSVLTLNAITISHSAQLASNMIHLDGWKGSMVFDGIIINSNNGITAATGRAIVKSDGATAISIRNMTLNAASGVRACYVFEIWNNLGAVTATMLTYTGSGVTQGRFFAVSFAQTFNLTLYDISLTGPIWGLAYSDKADAINIRNVGFTHTDTTQTWWTFDFNTGANGNGQLFIDGLYVTGCASAAAWGAVPFKSATNMGRIVVNNVVASSFTGTVISIAGTNVFPIIVRNSTFACGSNTGCRAYAMSGSDITTIDNIVQTGGGGFLTYSCRAPADNSNDPRLTIRNVTVTGLTITNRVMALTGSIKFGIDITDSRFEATAASVSEHIWLSNYLYMKIYNVISSYGNYFIKIDAAATNAYLNVTSVTITNVKVVAIEAFSGTATGWVDLKYLTIVGNLASTRGIRLLNARSVEISQVTMTGSGSGILYCSTVAGAVVNVHDIDIRGMTHGQCETGNYPTYDYSHHYFLWIANTAGQNSTNILRDIYMEHHATAQPSQCAAVHQYHVVIHNVRDILVENVTMVKGLGAIALSATSFNGNGAITFRNCKTVDNARTVNAQVWYVGGVVGSLAAPGTIVTLENLESRHVSTGSVGNLNTFVPHFNVVNFGRLTFRNNKIVHGSRVLMTSQGSAGYANLTIENIDIESMLCSAYTIPSAGTYPLFDVAAGQQGGVVRIHNVTTACTDVMMNTNKVWVVRGGNDVEIYDLTNSGGERFLEYAQSGSDAASIKIHDIVTTTMYGAASSAYTFWMSGYDTSNRGAKFEVRDIVIDALATSSMSTHFYVQYYYNYSISNVSAVAGSTFQSSGLQHGNANFYIKDIRFTNVPSTSTACYFNAYGGTLSGVIRVSDFAVQGTNVLSRVLCAGGGVDVIVERINITGQSYGLLWYTSPVANQMVIVRDCDVRGVGPVFDSRIPIPPYYVPGMDDCDDFCSFLRCLQHIFLRHNDVFIRTQEHCFVSDYRFPRSSFRSR